MITTAGNELADKILELQRRNENIAQMKAVDFVRNEKPEDKFSFQKYSELAEAYREMHGIVCAGLHKVEAEMRNKS